MIHGASVVLRPEVVEQFDFSKGSVPSIIYRTWLRCPGNCGLNIPATALIFSSSGRDRPPDCPQTPQRGVPTSTRRESAEEKARRIMQEELDKLGWRARDLAARSKGDVRKVRLARRLRTETGVTWKWISEQLHMGTWTYAASLKIKTEPDEQNEFKLV
jgi:hypothetical protein